MGPNASIHTMWPQKESGPPTTEFDDDHSIAVFGGGREGSTIATRLAEAGASVSFFDESPTVLQQTADAVDTGQVVLDDANSLACTNADDASIVVVAGRTDRRNFLLAQLLRTSVGVQDIVFRVNQPANANAFETIGLETVTPGDDVHGEVCAAVDRTLRQRSSA